MGCWKCSDLNSVLYLLTGHSYILSSCGGIPVVNAYAVLLFSTRVGCWHAKLRYIPNKKMLFQES